MAKVLLVEDDLPLSRLYARVLEAEHEVIMVDSAADAMAAFDAHHPQIVILDLNLPDEPGTQVLLHLAPRASADLRVIIMTGFSHHNTKDFGDLVYDVMEKPVMASVLLRVVNEALYS